MRMNHELCCGAVVYKKENGTIKYVIVQQLEGVWGLPKGHMKEGETEKETALREIFEEVGLRTIIHNGFRIIDECQVKNTNIIKTVVYFCAGYCNQDIVIQKSELLNATIVSYDQAIDMLDYDSTKCILKKANELLIKNN